MVSNKMVTFGSTTVPHPNEAPVRRTTIVFDGQEPVKRRALPPSREREAAGKGALRPARAAPPAVAPLGVISNGRLKLTSGKKVHPCDADSAAAGSALADTHQGATLFPRSRRKIAEADQLDSDIARLLGDNSLHWVAREQGLGNYNGRKAALSLIRQLHESQQDVPNLERRGLRSVPPIYAELPMPRGGLNVANNKIAHLPPELFRSPLLGEVHFSPSAITFMGADEDDAPALLGKLVLRGNPVVASYAKLPQPCSPEQAADFFTALQREVDGNI